MRNIHKSFIIPRFDSLTLKNLKEIHALSPLKRLQEFFKNLGLETFKGVSQSFRKSPPLVLRISSKRLLWVSLGVFKSSGFESFRGLRKDYETHALSPLKRFQKFFEKSRPWVFQEGFKHSLKNSQPESFEEASKFN